MGRLEGKVAFITGAARGQGRSHAVKLAQEGADIIAVDLCQDVDMVPYPLATPEDLVETVRQVEALDRRIVATQADVRDLGSLQAAVETGVAQLGRLDIVLANAGVATMGAEPEDLVSAWQLVVDINLTGVWATVRACTPVLVDQGEGGAIVLTSSTAGLKGLGGASAGGEAYAASKHGVVGLMRVFARNLAQHRIRVNSVHPTGVNTPMVINEAMNEWLQSAPDRGDVLKNLLPVELVEPIDVSNAIMYLVSDEGRYITGVTLPVDAGLNVM
jgi:SDR family mycofactocin-dependent oxidoreductase